VVFKISPDHRRAHYQGSFVLYRDGSVAARDLKNDPQAVAALAAFKKKEGIVFLQIVDMESGQARAQVAVDTGKYSFQLRDLLATKDRLVLADTHDRVLVYGGRGRREVSSQQRVFCERANGPSLCSGLLLGHVADHREFVDLVLIGLDDQQQPEGENRQAIQRP